MYIKQISKKIPKGILNGNLTLTLGFQLPSSPPLNFFWVLPQVACTYISINVFTSYVSQIISYYTYQFFIFLLHLRVHLRNCSISIWRAGSSWWLSNIPLHRPKLILLKCLFSSSVNFAITDNAAVMDMLGACEYICKSENGLIKFILNFDRYCQIILQRGDTN